jgi:hypothetical protein
MGRAQCDHIKRLITLTSDNIMQLLLYFQFQIQRQKFLSVYKLQVLYWSMLLL